MARRFKSKKSKSSKRRRVGAAVGSRRRRRRVGAMAINASSQLVQYGSIAAGFLFADKINELIDKPIGDKVDGKIVAAGQVGVGAAYIFFMKGKKNLPLTVLTGALMGAGVKRAMTEFGIGAFGPYSQNPVVAGAYGNVKVISRVGQPGYSPNRSLNGYTPNNSLNGSVRNIVGTVHDGTPQ